MPVADIRPASVALLDAFPEYEDAVDGLAPPTVLNHRTYLEALLRWWGRERAPAGRRRRPRRRT